MTSAFRDLHGVELLSESLSFLDFRVDTSVWPRRTILELRFSRYLRSVREWEFLTEALGLVSCSKKAVPVSRPSRDLRTLGHGELVVFGFNSDLISVEETYTGQPEDICLFFEQDDSGSFEGSERLQDLNLSEADREESREELELSKNGGVEKSSGEKGGEVTPLPLAISTFNPVVEGPHFSNAMILSESIFGL